MIYVFLFVVYFCYIFNTTKVQTLFLFAKNHFKNLSISASISLIIRERTLNGFSKIVFSVCCIFCGIADTFDTIQPNVAFRIGQYHFDPNKNELTGFGECIQLNKKENSILQALCAKQGNVVERNLLLDENWGSLGLVYSRSLDTYLATLRKYLRKDSSVQIVTIKGVGYKLVY